MAEPTLAPKSASPLDPSGDISVVIVTYRIPEILSECLASFERHRPRRVGQVIVVDNSIVVEGAPPNEQFPWIDYIANGENVHFRKATNQGARLARLKYLLVLNPDTYLTDGESLALLAEVLDREPGIGMVGPKIRGDDGQLAPQGERLAGLGYLIALKTYLNLLWPGNPIARRHFRAGVSREISGPVDTLAAAAVLFRREEFLAVGGFDERATVYWEEQEVARKLKRRGLGGFYRADAFVYHRWRKGGSEVDGREQVERYFEEAMRLYYRQFYGPLGGVLYDVLNRAQACGRAASRALRRRRA